MNWDDGADFLSAFCSRCAIRIYLTILLQAFPNRGWANVVRFGIDVGEKRSGADARDSASGGEKCVRRRDNGIA